MLAKKTTYALKALQFLAREYRNGPVLISELAERERIPKKFLELILLTLKNHGILQSKKGKGGGYFLGKSPAIITVGEIIRIFEGPIAPLPCLSGDVTKCLEGYDETVCGIRMVMAEVRDSTVKILDGTTLAALEHRSKTAREKQRGILTYQI